MNKSKRREIDASDVLATKLRDYERGLIRDELAEHDGHVQKTADALGIPKRTLQSRMSELGLQELAAELRTKAGIRGPRGPASGED